MSTQNGLFSEIDPKTGSLLGQTLFDGVPHDATRTESFTLPAGGVWTVYFGVGQSGDTQVSSWLQLDNVALASKCPSRRPGRCCLPVFWRWAGERAGTGRAPTPRGREVSGSRPRPCPSA